MNLYIRVKENEMSKALSVLSEAGIDCKKVRNLTDEFILSEVINYFEDNTESIKEIYYENEKFAKLGLDLFTERLSEVVVNNIAHYSEDFTDIQNIPQQIEFALNDDIDVNIILRGKLDDEDFNKEDYMVHNEIKRFAETLVSSSEKWFVLNNIHLVKKLVHERPCTEGDIQFAIHDIVTKFVEETDILPFEEDLNVY